MTAYTFSQLIDFTRTSAATYVDASGRIVPTPASRNLLTFTQEFDNAGWTKSGATVTANSTTAPDGTLTADKITPDTNSSTKAVRQTIALSGTNTWSFYAKAAGYTKVGVWDHAITGAYASFNLAGAGSVLASGSGASGATITSVGNGWYRCSFVATASGNIGFSFQVLPDSYTTGPISGAWVGDGTSGVFLWGAQLEANTTATDYTRNNGGVYPPRFDYDPVTLAPRGLLVEEQRTNLLLRSEEFQNAVWVDISAGVTTKTGNFAVAPDGTTTACRIQGNNANTWLAQSATGTFNSQTLTWSFWARANSGTPSGVSIIISVSGGSSFNVPITVTSAWQRFTLTSTLLAGDTGSVRAAINHGNGNDILVWGAQLEAGSFATSYIPTVASQVTRTADVATITGANFSQWFNAAEGSLVIDISAQDSKTLASLSDGTSSNRMASSSGGLYHLYVAAGGVEQANIDAGTFPVNTNAKLAFAYAANNFAAVINGGTAGTDTSGSVPVVNRLSIGMAGDNTAQINGHIRSLRYYPTRLSNAQLQALTA